MSEKRTTGCVINKLEYDPTAKVVTWESKLSSSLKCDAWEIGEYSTRVDGTRVPLETLMRALITQYIGVRKINAPLKKLSKADAQKALTAGFNWNDMFTKAAKLTPAEQAKSSVSKITDLNELQKLLAEVQAKVMELTKSETPA